MRCCPQKEAQRWLHSSNASSPGPARAAAFLEVLTLIANALNQANIPFYIVGGTLLGWQRECQFIAHTTDIDIAVFEEDWDADRIHYSMKNGGF